MSSTFGGSRSSAELPVVCLLVGAPGFDPGRLQQSAAPVYKTEPHASADAVRRVRAIFLIARREWSEWVDLNQRPLRSERRALPGCATLRVWRAVRESNPSRSIDSRAASPDA